LIQVFSGPIYYEGRIEFAPNRGEADAEVPTVIARRSLSSKEPTDDRFDQS
jgi:hypothetical protein